MKNVYGCMGCGAYFTVNISGSKEPKRTPCCGGSEINKFSFEEIIGNEELKELASQ